MYANMLEKRGKILLLVGAHYLLLDLDLDIKDSHLYFNIKVET